jgi:hypothetical protein
MPERKIIRAAAVIMMIKILTNHQLSIRMMRMKETSLISLETRTV